MVYRSLMMGVLLLAMTYFTDPSLLFAGKTASGNELVYGPMSPKKAIDPTTGKNALEVQLDVKETTNWIPALLQYEVREYTAGGGLLDKQFCKENTKHSAPRWYVPLDKNTVNMKVIDPSCGFVYTGPPPAQPAETATEPSSGLVKVK